MADTKVSAMTDVTAVADTTEWHVSEAGADKALSVATFMDYFRREMVLASDATTTSTTLAECAGLALPLSAGTWMYQYNVMSQSSANATAITLGINFDGTATRQVHEATAHEATTLASAGTLTATHAAFGLRAGGQNNAFSTTAVILGPTGQVQAVDHLIVIKGLVVVTVAGNLELWFGADVTNTGTQSIEAGSSVIAWNVV